MTRSERILLKHLSDDEAKYIANKQFLYQSIIEAIDEAEALSSYFKNNECQHKDVTQHFSDIFGYYKTCLDCGKNIDLVAKPRRKSCLL